MLHMKHSMKTCTANLIAFASQMKSIIGFDAFFLKTDNSREISPVLSEYFEKDKKRLRKDISFT